VLTALGLLAGGAAILYVGAEAAVRGTAGLARTAGISLFVLGALLFGTDLEGLGAAVVAAGRGQTAMASGEIFGSILFVWSVAFGLAVLLSRGPVPTPGQPMILAPAIPLAAAAIVVFDGTVARWEGVGLLVMFGLYVWFVVREGRAAVRRRAEEIGQEAAEGPRPGGVQAALALGGLAVLYVGATVIVAGAERLAAETDLLAGFVGAAILGALVSLDEVFLELLPIRRGAPDLATGNLFGTLGAFTTGVLGMAALVRPLEVDGAGALALLGVAVLYALVGTTFLRRQRVGKVVGLSVLLLYGAWVVLASAV
jgi:cation:H+ antiporter